MPLCFNKFQTACVLKALLCKYMSSIQALLDLFLVFTTTGSA